MTRRSSDHVPWMQDTPPLHKLPTMQPNSPPPDESPMKASSSRSMASADTLTSLATANDFFDSRTHTPERMRQRSHSVPGTAISMPHDEAAAAAAAAAVTTTSESVHNVPDSMSDDQAHVGALALAPHDDNDDDATMMTGLHDAESTTHAAGASHSSEHDLFLESRWDEWNADAMTTPLHEQGAQELLDNLGLDALDVQSQRLSPRSSHSQASTDRTDRVEPVPDMPLHPGEAFGVAHGGTPVEEPGTNFATSPSPKSSWPSSEARVAPASDASETITSGQPRASSVASPARGSFDAPASAEAAPSSTSSAALPVTSLSGSPPPSPPAHGPSSAPALSSSAPPVPPTPPSSSLPPSTPMVPATELGTLLDSDSRFRPLNRMLEPLNIKALSLQEGDTDAASNAAPTVNSTWPLRFKPRNVDGDTMPGPSAHASGHHSIDEEAPAEQRASGDDDAIRVHRALRGSKSSSLLTAVASQANRIRKNARDAWPVVHDDDPVASSSTKTEDDDRERAKERKSKTAQRSDDGESCQPPASAPVSSQDMAVSAPTSKETGKPDTPLSMYRKKRNKSQPTLRIADDREFLEALEQVRMQHKERIAHRERARTSRKASMPNLRPSPASRRPPPLPMTRGFSERTERPGRLGDERKVRSRASSAASRSEIDSARMSMSPEMPAGLPDMSTSFLDIDSIESMSASSTASDEPPDAAIPSSASAGGAAAAAAAAAATSPDTMEPGTGASCAPTGAHDAPDDDVDDVDETESNESNVSEPIPNELGIGHTTGNVPSAPFTNDDDWKKEVKALFLIRELVQTERSYAAHLESLLIVVLKCTGTSSSTRMQTNVLMPSQPSNTSQRMASNTTVPPHLVTLRVMLPKLISVSRVLVYSIEESPTSEGVARSFLSIRPRLEEVHVSWHGVVGATLRAMRVTEASKSKSKGRLGRVPVAPTVEAARRATRPDLSYSDAALDSTSSTSSSDKREKSRAYDPPPKELSAVDVAIMPTQRIPRYVLLLRDLLSYTSPDTEAYESLKLALETVQELGHRCDQASTKTQ